MARGQRASVGRSDLDSDPCNLFWFPFFMLPSNFVFVLWCRHEKRLASDFFNVTFIITSMCQHQPVLSSCLISPSPQKRQRCSVLPVVDQTFASWSRNLGADPGPLQYSVPWKYWCHDDDQAFESEGNPTTAQSPNNSYFSLLRFAKPTSLSLPRSSPNVYAENRNTIQFTTRVPRRRGRGPTVVRRECMKSLIPLTPS